MINLFVFALLCCVQSLRGKRYLSRKTPETKFEIYRDPDKRGDI